MNHIFTISLCFLALSLSAQETITYPYNPDGNSDGLVAVPDLQDILAVYGNPFSPAEIMVGDTALSEWIQILYQALQDQQAVINAMQGSGGCNYSFPDGLDGEAVHFDLIDDGPYTVPAGKNLYVFKFIHKAEVVVITVDGKEVCKSRSTLQLGYDHFTPYIIGQSSIVDFTTANLDSDVESVFLTGMLVDRNVDPQVISIQGVDGSGISIDSFTIPENKTFYITDAFYTPFELGNPAQVLLNGERWTETVKDDRTIAAVTFPVAIGEGNVISLEGGTSGNNHNISGYLVDEDYFANCGGGSSEGGFLNTALGQTEHYKFFELEWLPQMNSSYYYFTSLQFENDGFLRVSGGNAGINLIVVPDSTPVNQFSTADLAEANFDDSFWSGVPPITIPLNSDEQLVLYGGIGVVDEGYTEWQLDVYWTPLQSQETQSGGGSEDESVTIVNFPESDETPNDIYISDYSRFIIVDGPPNTGNYTVYVSDSWNPENNSKFITLVNRTGAYMYFENQFNTYGIESGNAVDFVIIDGACYRTE